MMQVLFRRSWSLILSLLLTLKATEYHDCLKTYEISALPDQIAIENKRAIKTKLAEIYAWAQTQERDRRAEDLRRALLLPIYYYESII